MEMTLSELVLAALLQAVVYVSPLGQGLSPNDWDNLLALAVLLRQPPPWGTTSAGSSKSSALIESRYSAPVRPWVQMSTRLWGGQR